MINILRAFLKGRDRFTVRFNINSKIEIALWERPGHFLDDDALAAIVDDMRQVADAGQKEKDVPLYGALLGDREDLKRRIITIAYERQSKKPIGFNAMAYLDVPLGLEVTSIMHLGLVFVHPQYQRQHLPDLLYGAATFLLFFKRGLRANWISNVTQVPAIIGMTGNKFANVYPTHRGNPQSFTHLALSRAIMRDHRSAFGVGDDAWFDETKQVIKNAYTGGSDELKKTFDEAPKHRDDRVNQMCRTWLDYDRGDDILQLGLFTIRSALGFLRTKMPKGASFQLGFTALTLIVLGVLTPIVHWLVPPETQTQKGET